MTEKPDKSDTADKFAALLPLGVAVGISLGMAFGIVMDNLALGLSLGVAIGAGLGVAVMGMAKTRTSREPASRDGGATPSSGESGPSPHKAEDNRWDDGGDGGDVGGD